MYLMYNYSDTGDAAISVIFFVLVVLLGAFFTMNLVLAIIVDSFNEASQGGEEDEEEGMEDGQGESADGADEVDNDDDEQNKKERGKEDAGLEETKKVNNLGINAELSEISQKADAPQNLGVPEGVDKRNASKDSFLPQIGSSIIGKE